MGIDRETLFGYTFSEPIRVWGDRQVEPCNVRPQFGFFVWIRVDICCVIQYTVNRVDSVFADRQVEPCKLRPVIGSVFVYIFPVEI